MGFNHLLYLTELNRLEILIGTGTRYRALHRGFGIHLPPCGYPYDLKIPVGVPGYISLCCKLCLCFPGTSLVFKVHSAAIDAPRGGCLDIELRLLLYVHALESKLSFLKLQVGSYPQVLKSPLPGANQSLFYDSAIRQGHLDLSPW